MASSLNSVYKNLQVYTNNKEREDVEEFYIRRNASAINLTMYEMITYIKDNWG